jgi:glycosyltransferase involved in cell wall biosynthesis
MTRVTIVHERFTELGGSEKVVAELTRVWPGSRVIAPFGTDEIGRSAGIETPVEFGRLQPLYRRGPGYAHLLPLIPLGMKDLDLAESDLVVVSHHAFANRVRLPDGAASLGYIHSPGRWMWDPAMRHLEVSSVPGRAALGGFARSQLQADRRAAARLGRLVANSATVANRIAEWWGLAADVVHPPTDLDYFSPDPDTPREEFVLLAGRLVPYKRPEIAVAAARRAGVPLVVAGDGRSIETCREAAGPRATFLGAVSDDQLRNLFRRCRAVLFPGVEDFGMIPVEAQACGAPVVAVAAGGATETVVDGVTGRLVPFSADADCQAAALADALENDTLESMAGDAAVRNAERFGRDVFHRSIRAIGDDLLADR